MIGPDGKSLCPSCIPLPIGPASEDSTEGVCIIQPYPGVISPALASKLSSNLTKANAQVRTKALETTSSTASLASSILAADSALFSDLSPEERPLAEALARTMQVGLGAELEDVSLRWTGWEGACSNV